MKYGELGRSGMNVSKICLGTMHFGPKATEEESHAILDKALSMGITFIDTANVYGGEAARGRSEEIIGTWFAARPGVREEVVLATKVYGAMGDLGPANNNRGFSAYKVRKHLADSLRRLQTDRIDLYQIHHIDERVSAEEWFHGLRIRADAVQLAEPGARDGGSPGGAGLRDRGDRLHAVGGRSTDGQNRVPRRQPDPSSGGGVRDPGRSREPPVPRLLPALSRPRGT
jgi:hypothetical protein